MTAGALRLDGITRQYPGQERPAVSGVSLEVRPGELLALVGASGSGKTTTLRIAAGYEPPDGGRVLLSDAEGAPKDITRVPPQRRGFGMVFQHYALFPHLSVEENVAFGLEARGVARRERLAQARAALDAVGLGGKAQRPVQALSGGEQQRVALARALVIEPPVLLLDEPLSNLDPTLRQTMRDELRAMLRRLHVTALFVTHDQEDAFAVADRVAMLHHGRLLQVGAPEELYGRPASREVAAFVGRAVLLPVAEVAPASGGGPARFCIRVAGVTQEGTARLGADGQRVGRWLAVLRPESLTLAPADAAGVWRGLVTNRRFVGGHVTYTVRMADDTELEVADQDGQPREGDTVGVRLDARDVSLVPA